MSLATLIALLPAAAQTPVTLIINPLYTQEGKIISIEPEVVETGNIFYQEETREFANDSARLSDSIILLDKDNQQIYTQQLPHSERIIINLDKEKIVAVDSIAMQRNGNIYFTKLLSFCDNDQQCEPCAGNCVLMESSLTCDDCASGTGDNYCDLQQDNICDPDCSNKERDCASCEPYCFYKGMPELMVTGVISQRPNGRPSELCSLLKDGVCEAACPEKDLDCLCGNDVCEQYENPDTCSLDCKPTKNYFCMAIRDNVCDPSCLGADIDCTMISLVDRTASYYQKNENFYTTTMIILTSIIAGLVGLSFWLLHSIYNIRMGE